MNDRGGDQLPFRTISVSVSPEGYTTPGQSIKKILLKRVMYCQTFVSPGMGATLHTFLDLFFWGGEGEGEGGGGGK